MKVSVVMPVFNGAKFLQQAIDSILNQTYTDFEFIIIDDGSSDESAAIIAKSASVDKRIKFLQNKKNSGICVTLNNGLDVAKGEYIVRMDCDDISEPNRIEEQVTFMDSHREYGVVGSKIRIFGEGIQKSYIFDFDEDWRMNIANMIFATCVAHPAVIIRKEVLTAYRIQYEDSFRGMEDFYMWWNISKYAKISNIQLPLLNYRKHEKQVTKKVIDNAFRIMASSFLEERLSDFHIILDDCQKKYVLRYIYGDFKFNDSELLDFISLCMKIIKDTRLSRPELTSSIKLVLAKAISQIIISSKLYKSKAYYMRKAFISGCMPFMWFVKSRTHQIIGR